jgi:hypothetical protein
MPGENDEKTRRINASAQLAERAKEFAKVKYDARIGALHDQLMYAIELAVKEQPGDQGRPAFTDAQVTIMKDVACHLLLLLDPDGRKKAGFFARCWREWVEYTPLKKIATFAIAMSFLIGGMYGAWKGYREIVDHYYGPAAPTGTKPPTSTGPTTQKQSDTTGTVAPLTVQPPITIPGVLPLPLPLPIPRPK